MHLATIFCGYPSGAEDPWILVLLRRSQLTCVYHEMALGPGRKSNEVLPCIVASHEACREEVLPDEELGQKRALR